MPRPIHADARATQQRILERASARFATHGMAGASARQIAKDASVSLAMVHHYFGSKDGLYRACVGAMFEELGALGGQLASTLAQPDATPAAVLERAVRVGWQFARANRGAVRLLQRSIVEAGEVDVEIREKRILPFLEIVSSRLATLTGRPASSLRLSIQSAIFLVVRYAIASDRELAELAFGPLGARGGDDAAQAVEDDLVRSVLAMVAVAP